jgi:hypothetical protein
MEGGVEQRATGGAWRVAPARSARTADEHHEPLARQVLRPAASAPLAVIAGRWDGVFELELRGAGHGRSVRPESVGQKLDTAMCLQAKYLNLVGADGIEPPTFAL